MILLVHMLFGVAVASKIQNPFFAIILAFLSHYLLDAIPHVEYSIKKIKSNKFKEAWPDLLKILIDLFLGSLLVWLLSGREFIAFIIAFFAIIPDGLTVLEFIFPNKILKAHSNIHREKIHFLKYKKIPLFWRIFSQTTTIALSIAILLIK